MKWELRTLGDLGEWGSGGTPLSSTPEYYNGTIPWLIIEDLNDGVVTSSQKTITELGLKNSSAKIVEPGTLLIAMYGSIGKLGISGIRCATNQAIAFCRHNPELVDVNFLFYYLLFSREKLLDMGKGNTQQNIGQAVLKEYEIPLPPLTEQKRIASLLARADRLRHLRRTAHELGETLLQSVFLEMFGDPFRNEKGWERIEVAELIRSGDTINYGVVQPGDDFPNGTPVIRVGDLDNLDKDITSLKLIDPKIEASYKRSRIVGDEILIACVGSIGKIALATEKMKGFNIVRAVARVPADYSLVNRLFLAAYLSMPIIQDFFQRETRTVAQPTLNITQIEETPILMPPLSLQEEFAGVVARVESLRGRMSEGERQVEGLFESLLAEAFS